MMDSIVTGAYVAVGSVAIIVTVAYLFYYWYTNHNY